LQNDLLTGDPAALRIVGPGMFKDFARRHLLMDVNATYYWLRDMLGEPDEAAKFRASARDQFSGVRGFEILGFFANDDGGFLPDVVWREMHRENKTWFPWEMTEGKL